MDAEPSTVLRSDVQFWRSEETSITSLSPGWPWMVNWHWPLLTLIKLRVGGRFSAPTVVRLRLHPPMVPSSLIASSTTKRDQVPFGSMPVKVERSAVYE